MNEGGEDLPVRDLGPIQPNEEREIVEGAERFLSARTRNDTAKRTTLSPKDKKLEAWWHPEETAEAIHRRTDLTEEQKLGLIDQRIARRREERFIIANLTQEVKAAHPGLLDEHDPTRLQQLGLSSEWQFFSEEAPTARARTYALGLAKTLQAVLAQDPERVKLGDEPFSPQDVIDYHEYFSQRSSENFTLIQLLGAVRRLLFISYQTKDASPHLHEDYPQTLTLYRLVHKAARPTDQVQ